MIKKIIGLVLICLIFFFAIKAITFLPYLTSLNNLVIGPNKSPFQVGTEYIDQINDLYPYANQNANFNSSIKYGAANSITKGSVLSKVTLQKSYGKLILSVENGNPNANLNIWLTNTPDITDKTGYIDFGPLYKSVGVRSYAVDMKGGDVSLAEYNNVLIVDKNYQIYARVMLK